MAERGGIERVWTGDGALARSARLLLTPAAWLYGGVVAARNAMYDRGLLAVHDTAIPVLSVGNLTVGGTGKTPVAAWLAATLAAQGARPALILRGYGDDEPAVHRALNPELIVIVDADRAAGVARAAAAGADVAVLDDAFQHRRVRRQADLVLVSTEQWEQSHQLLPAGPWRESLGALRRATLCLVTRKSSTHAAAALVAGAVRQTSPDVPVGVLHLALDAIRRADGTVGVPPSLSGARVLAIAGIGDPHSLARQLGQAGAAVRLATFPDHHPYSAEDATRLAGSVRGGEVVVCTLKDAVKLSALWPRAGSPLWYVCQRLELDEGEEALTAVLGGVLDARFSHSRMPDPGDASHP